jgi:zinc-ribbon domain
LPAVYCPRCGAENEDGSRYCVSCGNALPRDGGGKLTEDDSGPSPAGNGGDQGDGPAGAFDRIVGTTRKARLVSAGIAIAIVAAIVAFIALGSDDESTIPQDGLTKALDATCVHRKIEIAKAQAAAVNGADLASVSRYGDSMVKLAGGWRLSLGRLSVPRDRSEPLELLREALLEVQIEAGTLARSAREANKAEVAVSAGRVDAATAGVEAAISGLELKRCSQLVFASGRLIRE